MCIEDKLFPKMNSFVKGEAQPLAGIDEFAGKLRAAKDAQSDEHFTVVARIEALIAAFHRASFAQSIVFHQLEVVFAALLGLMLFHETPSLLAWGGIVLCGVGVLWLEAPGRSPAARCPSHYSSFAGRMLLGVTGPEEFVRDL